MRVESFAEQICPAESYHRQLLLNPSPLDNLAIFDTVAVHSIVYKSLGNFAAVHCLRNHHSERISPCSTAPPHTFIFLA